MTQKFVQHYKRLRKEEHMNKTQMFNYIESYLTIPESFDEEMFDLRLDMVEPILDDLLRERP